MIKAVVFDLDDTLVPEKEYVKSGFKAVAEYFGDETLFEKLWNLFDEDKNNVYQRAGLSADECQEAIEIYRKHFPDIRLSDATEKILNHLKDMKVKLGIITDGRPTSQWNKIYALGLDKIIDKIIVTDEIGGEEFRKPNPIAFDIMREALEIEYDEMIYVGDNPSKDFYIGSIYPIKTVRLIGCKGIYSSSEYFKNIQEMIRINTIDELLEHIS